MGLVIAHLTLTIPLITWIMCGFFGALPRNLEKAARIDGLTRLQTLVRVVVPLSSLAKITVDEGPNEINREDGKRRVVIQCNAPGRDLSGFVDVPKSIAVLDFA